MRVGLVVYGDLTRTSGGYLYDRMLVQHLRERGDEVIVFSQPERPYPFGLIDNADVGFWGEIVAADVDVLLQDELNHASLAVGNALWKPAVDAPIVAIVHHLRSREQRAAWANRGIQALERLFLETVDACVSNSPVTRRTVQTLIGPHSGVVARPSGRRWPAADPDAAAERALRSGPLRLIYLGNVIPRKRLDLLLEGLRQVEDLDWHLDVAGDLNADPAFTSAIHDHVSALDDPNRVTFHGRLPDDDLKTLLDRSHVLAVPSAYEGYGIVYVEAMGRGLPVLASPHGGVTDVVEDGVTGVFADSASAIGRAVHSWATDRRRLAAMARAAVHVYEETPTWEETTARIADFLDDLVDAA